jgi:hypothetical protein
MKKSLSILLLCVLTILAADTVEEETGFDLVFEYPYQRSFGVRVYTNSASGPMLHREFQTNAVRLFSTNANNFTYGVSVSGQPFGNVTYYAALVGGLNSGSVTGVLSDPCEIQFRPRKPGNLRRFGQ